MTKTKRCRVYYCQLDAGPNPAMFFRICIHPDGSMQVNKVKMRWNRREGQYDETTLAVWRRTDRIAPENPNGTIHD